jgi:hypothetical protein
MVLANPTYVHKIGVSLVILSPMTDILVSSLHNAQQHSAHANNTFS